MGAAFANRHSSAVPWLSSTNTDVASPGFKHLCNAQIKQVQIQRMLLFWNYIAGWAITLKKPNL